MAKQLRLFQQARKRLVHPGLFKMRIIENGNFVRYFRLSIFLSGVFLIYFGLDLEGWNSTLRLAMVLIGIVFSSLGGYASQANLLQIRPFKTGYEKARQSCDQDN
ncbi:hypothetical protein [Herbaspirillum aquaticum]|uniref:hypothetical protein n=1 Tax=Herbaspirillum aquaticum TaxID=568783 RepID=UPI0024DE7062|nr:hypothetical protein [Herbaspirillum aquaticum]